MGDCEEGALFVGDKKQCLQESAFPVLRLHFLCTKAKVEIVGGCACVM